MSARLFSYPILFSLLLQPVAHARSIYHTIAQDLLSPFDQEIIGEDTVNWAGDGNDDNFTEGQKRTIVFNLFARFSSSNNYKPSYPVVSTAPIIKDLEIFTQGNGNLFRKICTTKTVFGQAVFARMLAEPTSDIQELQRRQGITQAFLNSPQLFEFAERCLDEIKTIEPLLLSFFSQKNELRQRMLSDLYFNKELWGHFDVNTNSWDKRPGLLMASEVASKTMTLFNLLLLYWKWDMAERVTGRPFLVTLTAIYTLLLLKPKTFMKIAPYGIPVGLWMLGKKAYEYWTVEDASDEARRIQREWDNYSPMGKLWYFVSVSMRSAYEKMTMMEFVVYTPYQLFLQGQDMRSWYYKYKHLQRKFSHLQKAITRLHGVNKQLLAQPELLRQVTELQPLVRALEHQVAVSDDLKKLLEFLAKPTFSDKFTIASNLGRIAATNKLMLGARPDWVRIFEAVGYLDSYLSIARLMRQYQNSAENPLCFAQYEQLDKPHLKLENFWNPFVEPGKKQVVLNSVELGTTARNMILTGPNTGGKSTIIKAMQLNTLLAQTFGIAAAQRCSLTPFSALLTYIRVEDDIERGLSLYRAEVERAKQLSTAVSSLRPDQFALVLIDEMFRGTARDQAALLSYWYAKENLGVCANCMLLEATHYPELIKLEQVTNGLFENYMVEIERNPDGSLKRTYVLKKGASTQNVAADILKEEGFAIKLG